MAPAGWHPITPVGLAANIYGVALAFSILSTIVLGLRVYARMSLKQFSLEDYLMCVGWVSQTTCMHFPSRLFYYYAALCTALYTG
jgi:hypothetical protein